MTIKKMTIAQFKKECGITPKDMKGWCYMDIIRTVKSNAISGFEQGYLTAKQRESVIAYGTTQANKGSY